MHQLADIRWLWQDKTCQHSSQDWLNRTHQIHSGLLCNSQSTCTFTLCLTLWKTLTYLLTNLNTTLMEIIVLETKVIQTLQIQYTGEIIPLHPHLVPWLLTNYFKAESLLCSQLTSLPILSKSFLFSQQLHPTFVHYCPLSLIISSKFYHKKQEKTIQPLLKFPACSLTRLNIEQLNLLSSPVLFPICLQGLGHNLQWKWTDSQSMQLLKK